MNDFVLELRNFAVYRGAGKKVLDIDELTLGRRELVAVVGPNGTGKSTLLQAVNLLLPYRGEMRLFGQETGGKTDSTRLRRRTAMVFQETLLLRGTVFDNLALPLKFRGLGDSEIRPRVMEALREFRCDHLAERRARSLSGGEGQRVCIARALVTAPELLLLDEPFAALDATLRGEMIEDLRRLAVDKGLTVLLVSHDFSDILSFADRVLAIFGGSIVQDDRPEALMRRPVDEKVARLAGMDNILPCRLEYDGLERRVKLAGGVSFACPDGVKDTVTACCIPGDAFSLWEGDDPEPGSRVILIGQVERVLPGIGASRVTVRLGDRLLIARIPPRDLAGHLQAGAALKLAFEPAETHFL